MITRTWVMLTLYIISKLATSELMGDHICQEEQKYKVNVTRYVLRNITVRDYKWCLQVPPRCSTYTIKQINDTKVEETEKIRYVRKCCDGYYEVNEEEKCVPNSCRSCKHGRCAENGSCHCDAGYWDSNCDKECIDNSWSTHCQNKCNDCVEGHCDTRTGSCLCPPKSIRCDLVCSEGHESGECMKYCKCDSMFVCHPFTKKCISVNRNYATEYSDYHDYSNYKLVKNNKIEYPRRRKYDNFDVTTSDELFLPYFKKASSQQMEYANINYFTTESFEDVFKRTTNMIITVENENENHIYKEQTDTTSMENSFSITGVTIEQNDEARFSLSKISTTSVKTSDVNGYSTVNATRVNVHVPKNKTEELNSVHTSNQSSQRILIDSHLFVTVISGALFTVLIIMSAAVICVLYKLREKRKKYINPVKEKQDANAGESMSSVSVTTRSIFHTPLPDPPIFENPAFLTQCEGAQHKPPKTLETHVICNMSFPKVTNHNQQAQDLFYDHPPSTGSHRAVSISESPNSNNVKNGFDPIYDEIPCNQRIVPVTTSPSHIPEQSILYMNTK